MITLIMASDFPVVAILARARALLGHPLIPTIGSHNFYVPHALLGKPRGLYNMRAPMCSLLFDPHPLLPRRLHTLIGNPLVALPLCPLLLVPCPLLTRSLLPRSGFLFSVFFWR